MLTVEELVIESLFHRLILINVRRHGVSSQSGAEGTNLDEEIDEEVPAEPSGDVNGAGSPSETGTRGGLGFLVMNSVCPQIRRAYGMTPTFRLGQSLISAESETETESEVGQSRIISSQSSIAEEFMAEHGFEVTEEVEMILSTSEIQLMKTTLRSPELQVEMPPTWHFGSNLLASDGGASDADNTRVLMPRGISLDNCNQFSIVKLQDKQDPGGHSLVLVQTNETDSNQIGPLQDLYQHPLLSGGKSLRKVKSMSDAETVPLSPRKLTKQKAIVSPVPTPVLTSRNMSVFVQQGSDMDDGQPPAPSAGDDLQASRSMLVKEAERIAPQVMDTGIQSGIWNLVKDISAKDDGRDAVAPPPAAGQNGQEPKAAEAVHGRAMAESRPFTMTGSYRMFSVEGNMDCKLTALEPGAGEDGLTPATSRDQPAAVKESPTEPVVEVRFTVEAGETELENTISSIKDIKCKIHEALSSPAAGSPELSSPSSALERDESSSTLVGIENGWTDGSDGHISRDEIRTVQTRAVGSLHTQPDRPQVLFSSEQCRGGSLEGMAGRLTGMPSVAEKMKTVQSQLREALCLCPQTIPDFHSEPDTWRSSPFKSSSKPAWQTGASGSDLSQSGSDAGNSPFRRLERADQERRGQRVIQQDPSIESMYFTPPESPGQEATSLPRGSTKPSVARHSMSHIVTYRDPMSPVDSLSDSFTFESSEGDESVTRYELDLPYDVPVYEKHADWMAELPEKVAALPLTEIVIPGSHISLAIDREMRMDMDFSKCNYEMAEFLRKLPNLAIFNSFRGLMKKIWKAWMPKQTLSVGQQLEAGVRYLDLRVTKLRGSFYGEHGLYTRPLKRYLKEINEFLVGHPKEVVVLHFQTLDQLEHVDKRHLVTGLFQVFGARLAVRAVPGKTSLTCLWQRRKQVIVVLPDADVMTLRDHVFHKLIWSDYEIVAPYPNNLSPDDLCAYLAEMDGEGSPLVRAGAEDKFHVVKAVLSPDMTMVFGEFQYRSMREMTEKMTTEVVSQWLRENSARKLNIVALDFVGTSSTVSDLVQMNFPKRETVV